MQTEFFEKVGKILEQARSNAKTFESVFDFLI